MNAIPTYDTVRTIKRQNLFYIKRNRLAQTLLSVLRIVLSLATTANVTFVHDLSTAFEQHGYGAFSHREEGIKNSTVILPLKIIQNDL